MSFLIEKKKKTTAFNTSLGCAAVQELDWPSMLGESERGRKRGRGAEGELERECERERERKRERVWFSSLCYFCCRLRCKTLHSYCLPSEFVGPRRSWPSLLSGKKKSQKRKTLQVREKKKKKVAAVCAAQQSAHSLSSGVEREISNLCHYHRFQGRGGEEEEEEEEERHDFIK